MPSLPAFCSCCFGTCGVPAVIIEMPSEAEMNRFPADAQAEVKPLQRPRKRDCKLSTSMGYALFGTETVQTVDQLIEAADNRMYQMKARRHIPQK